MIRIIITVPLFFSYGLSTITTLRLYTVNYGLNFKVRYFKFKKKRKKLECALKF